MVLFILNSICYYSSAYSFFSFVFVTFFLLFSKFLVVLSVFLELSVALFVCLLTEWDDFDLSGNEFYPVNSYSDPGVWIYFYL